MTAANLPAGVTVTEEWAVHSDDGHIYEVNDKSRETAEREAGLLQRGEPGNPEMVGEPGAAPAHRYVMETPQGTVATGWRWPCNWMPGDG
jgi:hypothetical protein